MDKLAGYVFVYADSNDATYIKFRSSTFLRPDIEEFKATVSATVKRNPVVEKMLMETVFKVREYYCCHENGAFPEKFSAEQLKHKSAINLALQKPKKLANELLALVSSTKNINTVIINRNIHGKEVNVNSLKKLSGHVFVYANSKTTDEIVFNDSFFVDDYIRWDIDIFKDELKKQLKDEFTNLKNYVFKVKDYNSFYPEELVSELPIDEKIEDKEIKEFFDELYFAVNQEDEVKLEQSMRERMTLKYGKAQGNIIYDYMMISVLNWLKEKGENPLDSDDIKERIENAKQQIRQLKTESSK
uniref:Uncharacterized protein n=1 Tax=Panagrolaimus sp. PS1159 TaxID=55785 RepID=A0AC35FGM6_9BILA